MSNGEILGQVDWAWSSMVKEGKGNFPQRSTDLLRMMTVYCSKYVTILPYIMD